MNILYISHLTTNIAAGPNWSVPARVEAQSIYDNVFLLNTTNVMMDHWQSVKAFHNLDEYGKLHLDNLPAPFSNPDIVVFEGFNFIEQIMFAKELRKRKIPYIITPRGAMTYEAQHNHARLKKYVARVLFQNSFVKHALAIQYLTEGERKNSMLMFKTRNFVLPNGITEPKEKKTTFSNEGINATFIGRLDMHHKGIDILLDAIQSILPELQYANFKLAIYGPRKYDYYKIENAINELKIGDVVELKDGISGNEKKEVLLNSDLFVMTSRLEGLPMGLLEAIAYGVPCFVSQGTNMREIIDKSDAGWTCETETSDIANALLKVLKEKDLIEIKSKNAIVLSEKYQWNQIARSFSIILNGLLDY